MKMKYKQQMNSELHTASVVLATIGSGNYFDYNGSLVEEC